MSSDLQIFDADVHHHFRWADLEDFLPEGLQAPFFAGNPHPKVTGVFREDTFPPRGGMPGSDPQFVIEDHLERFGIDYALLTCGSTLHLGDVADVDLAAAIARAANDWTINTWFPADQRFLGAVVVSPNDPDQAAEEIRRSGAHPRMVAVMCTQPPTLLGQPFMRPIFEACAQMGLPFQLHPGGPNARAGRLGSPTTMCEYRTSLAPIGMQHLTSLVLEGVFARYPSFRFVSSEWGSAWLPFVCWRLDMEYREHREEVPWLTRLPSEYIREQVRFTTQPVEEPSNQQDFFTLMSLVAAEQLLLFSSDYPHHDFDSPERTLKAFPASWRPPVFFANARGWYNLDERLGLRQPAGAEVA